MAFGGLRRGHMRCWICWNVRLRYCPAIACRKTTCPVAEDTGHLKFNERTLEDLPSDNKGKVNIVRRIGSASERETALHANAVYTGRGDHEEMLAHAASMRSTSAMAAEAWMMQLDIEDLRESLIEQNPWVEDTVELVHEMRQKLCSRADSTTLIQANESQGAAIETIVSMVSLSCFFSQCRTAPD